jgi:geranylgeranylglycerol-phosphate geranylgeranyltransferase
MKIWAWLRLLRPSNSLAAVGLVLLGAHLAGGWPWPPATWIAAGAMWAITSFGYVSNDLHDAAADQLNKPGRPLPSGRVRRSSAQVAVILLALLALGLASRIDALSLAAACVALFLLLLYNTYLKSTVLLGNFLVAILSGLALGIGSYTVGRPWAMALPGALVSLFVLAREVLKTIEDVPGDRHTGVRTVATTWGPRTAAGIFAATIGSFVALALAATWVGHYSSAYLAVIVSVSIGLAYSARLVWHEPTPARARIGLRVSKACYALGLLALLLAR